MRRICLICLAVAITGTITIAQRPSAVSADVKPTKESLQIVQKQIAARDGVPGIQQRDAELGQIARKDGQQFPLLLDQFFVLFAEPLAIPGGCGTIQPVAEFFYLPVKLEGLFQAFFLALARYVFPEGLDGQIDIIQRIAGFAIDMVIDCDGGCTA